MNNIFIFPAFKIFFNFPMICNTQQGFIMFLLNFLLPEIILNYSFLLFSDITYRKDFGKKLPSSQ